MFNHDTTLLLDGRILKINIAGKKTNCLLLLVFAVNDALSRHELIITSERHVVLEHVKDELLINCLLHALPQYISKAQKRHIGSRSCPF